MRRTTLPLLLGLICGLCSAIRPVYAKTLQVLQQHLQAADQALAQGRVIYVKTTTNPAEYAQSTVVAHYKITCVWAANGRFRRRVVPFQDVADLPTWEELCDGKQCTLISYKKDYVSLVRRSAREQEENVRMADLCCGSSFALGRGLSTLRHLHTARRGNKLYVYGLAADGSSVSARLDPLHGNVAHWILRQRANRRVGEWILGNPIRTPMGIWIAAQAHYDAYSAGEVVYKETYQLQASWIEPPPPSWFLPVIPTDSSIYDDRTQQTFIPSVKRPLPIGSVAPNFQVQDGSGRWSHLEDFRGHIVVLDFWATWCQPCQISFPSVAEVARKYADKNVVVLAVNMWDSEQAFKEWLPQHPEYRSVHFARDPLSIRDPLSKGNDDVAKLYHVQGIPTQYVITSDGKIVHCLVGAYKNAELLEAAVLAALRNVESFPQH